MRRDGALIEALHYAQDRGLAQVTVPTEELHRLLVDHDILRQDLVKADDELVRERQDASRREYGITTMPAGRPARPPVLDSLTEDVAVSVTLDDLVEAVSRVRTTQASAWSPQDWFRGAA